jgi:hypothetical protein
LIRRYPRALVLTTRHPYGGTEKMAQSLSCAILDRDAARLSLADAIDRVRLLAPRLVVSVVYGQNPNSGTTSMIGATRLARRMRRRLLGD